MTDATLKSTSSPAMSRLTPDIDLNAEGKATGFVRVPHSVPSLGLWLDSDPHTCASRTAMDPTC